MGCFTKSYSSSVLKDSVGVVQWEAKYTCRGALFIFKESTLTQQIGLGLMPVMFWWFVSSYKQLFSSVFHTSGQERCYKP